MTQPATQAPDDMLRGKRVVICEDEAMTFMQLARAFGKAGMEIVGSANDGIEAIHLIRQRRPDIVTMDLHMPAMNGIEAIRRVTSDHPTCIIVISAYSDETMVQEAMDAGACAYVHKPIEGQGVVKAVLEGYRKHLQSVDSSQSSQATSA